MIELNQNGNKIKCQKNTDNKNKGLLFQGRYQFKDKIGCGAFGQVLKVDDVIDGDQQKHLIAKVYTELDQYEMEVEVL